MKLLDFDTFVCENKYETKIHLQTGGFFMKRTSLLLIAFTLMLTLLAIGASAAETVIYENDFSDPATLSDFKQYRAEWEIKDGGLFMTDRIDPEAPKNAPSETFSFIIYQAKEKLTDYIVEVDYMNIQTMGGIIFRADQDAVSNASSNAFYGYLAFIANDASKGALGCSDAVGDWKGNINVGNTTGNCTMGSNVHIKVIVKGEKMHIIMTNIDSGKEVYNYIYKMGDSASDALWTEGTFGFRMRAEFATNMAVSANTAYFDNLKVTTANEVTIEETLPTNPETSQHLIDTSKLQSVYTNNFDNADALKDFTQYLGTWEVKDGRLYLTAPTGDHSFILYTGDSALTTLTDYVLDVDMYNTQTQGGPILRSNLEFVSDTSVNGFAGYIGFIAFTGNLGAVGVGIEDGGWGGNINVGSPAFEPNSNLHIQLAVKGNQLQCIFTDIATGKEIWSYAGTHDKWSQGTFGFRLYAKEKDGLINVGTTSFDNLVISKYSDGTTPTASTEIKMTIGDMNGYVNGVAKALDAAPIIRQNRTMLPVRFVAENLGAEVAWDGATSTATLTSGDIEIKITIGATTATINGEEKPLDAPAFIENSRTYLPVRFVAEALGGTVAWDGNTSTATITK